MQYAGVFFSCTKPIDETMVATASSKRATKKGSSEYRKVLMFSVGTARLKLVSRMQLWDIARTCGVILSAARKPRWLGDVSCLAAFYLKM